MKIDIFPKQREYIEWKIYKICEVKYVHKLLKILNDVLFSCVRNQISLR